MTTFSIHLSLTPASHNPLACSELSLPLRYFGRFDSQTKSNSISCSINSIEHKMLIDAKTGVTNHSESPVTLAIKDQFGVRKIKRIEVGEQIYISNWEGIESRKDGIVISYQVYPVDRPDVSATFLPIDVHDNNSEIMISCNMETVNLRFVPANEDLVCMSIARWVKGLFS